VPTTAMDNFTTMLRDEFPGGERALDHLDDGPWQFFTIWRVEDHWVRAALAAYPSRPTLVWQGGPAGSGIEATLHLLPEFVSKLVAVFANGFHYYRSNEDYSRPEYADVFWLPELLRSARWAPDRIEAAVSSLGHDPATYAQVHSALAVFAALPEDQLTALGDPHEAVIAALVSL
jgi:hypothetical protein